MFNREKNENRECLEEKGPVFLARKEKLHHIRQTLERIEADKNAFINLLHRARSQSRVSASRYVM